MKLLILGGTRFMGRHLAQHAIEAGHDVTLLHRGHSGPGLFPQARHWIADRNADLSALAGGRWDAAIDTNAYVPRHVRDVAAALAGRVGPERLGQYQLVSSISVYAGFDAPGQDEDAAVQTLADPATEDLNVSTYGGLKVVCEQAAQVGFAGRCLVARPGLLVGPHDPTGRFTWWVRRFQRAADDAAAQEVLAPGPPGAPVQCIDARDAAAWLLLQAERGGTGVFNLSGPAVPMTMGDVLGTLRQTLAPAARLTWVDERFLLDQGVKPWTDLPLWLPQASAGMHQVSLARALATGLQCRPLAQTVADTAAWAPERALPSSSGLPIPAVGLEPAREQALLAAWHAAAAAAAAG